MRYNPQYNLNEYEAAQYLSKHETELRALRRDRKGPAYEMRGRGSKRYPMYNVLDLDWFKHTEHWDTDGLWKTPGEQRRLERMIQTALEYERMEARVGS